MPRSQRHMREFNDHYDADASGQAIPEQTSTITDPASGTTLNEDFSGFFDAYPATYSGSNLPTGSSINATTGVVTGTVAASAWPTVSITVTNTYGTVTSNTFTWTVS